MTLEVSFLPKAHFYSQVISDSLKAKAEEKKNVWKEQALLQCNVSAKNPSAPGPVLGSCPDSRGLDNILSSIGVGWGTQGYRQAAPRTLVSPGT